MSFIEIPVADYRRMLAAAPTPPRSGREPADVRAVTDAEVLGARVRHPQAFSAIDDDPSLPPGEVVARERLITEAIRVGYLPPA